MTIAKGPCLGGTSNWRSDGTPPHSGICSRCGCPAQRQPIVTPTVRSDLEMRMIDPRANADLPAMAAPEAVSVGAQPVPSCRILVVDDSRLYREGLVHLLAAELGANAVQAADSSSAVDPRPNTYEPGIVIVNLASCQGEDVPSAVVERWPQARVIVVGVDDTNVQQVISCAEAGVSGYVTQDYSLRELMDVIRDVTLCGSHVSARISAVLLHRVREVAVRRRGPECLDILTDREIQILRLISDGLSNQNIADELVIELHTVKNHVHSVLTKLGARRRGEAAALLTGWRRIERESAGSGPTVPPPPTMDPLGDHRSWSAMGIGALEHRRAHP